MNKPARDPKLLRRVETSGTIPPASISDQELHILHSALRCFSRGGFAATSVRAIAAEAGVTGPMINYYFEGKEHLYRRLVQIVSDAMQARVARAAALPGTLHERLVRVMHAYVAFTVESPDAIAVFFGVAYGPSEGRPDVDMGAIRDVGQVGLIAVLEEAVESGSFVLRDGYDVRDLTSLCIGALVHVIGREVTDGFREDPMRGPRLESELERAVRVILDGIEARPEARS